MIALVATTLVICAPGYPGTSGEAQPTMDALARALAAEAHLPAGSLSVVYEETEAAGMRRLAQADAALLLATLPFHLAHEQQLGLSARLSAVPRDRDALERWSLVAAKERASSLDGYEIHSTAGYSPAFVRAAAPSLPRNVRITAVTAVLSSLRRAANGEKVAVLLDGTQTAALEKLPFASSLAVVETSQPMPVAVVSTVGKRVDPARWKALQGAFERVGKNPAAAEALEGVRMSAFVPLDQAALASARKAFRSAR
ncbi:MAG TPA: hypothetical protein VG496_07520 [Myxococcales bacterium]|nr:hypothetical protein [Myxococcales bacterium]